MPSKLRLDDVELIYLYRHGIGTNELAVRFGVHRTTIQRRLHSFGVPLRVKSPRYKYNYDFFAEYTPSSCYWAGFILADGNIRSESYTNTLHIKLSAIDAGHLRKFISDIGFTGRVHFNASRSYCYVNLSGCELIESLRINFGITPNKSLTATITDKIPVEYLGDFIRGIFDGDGSIYYKKNKISTGYVYDICCSFIGTFDVLSAIQEYAISKGIRCRSNASGRYKMVHRGNKNTYSFGYSHINSLKLLSELYMTSTVDTRLDRKYVIYTDKTRIYTMN